MTIRWPVRVVYLEWDDAATRAPWMTLEELDEYQRGQWLVRQSGFLLAETDTHLLIAGGWAPEDHWRVDQFGPTTRIPKAWIRHRRVLATIGRSGRLSFPTK